MASNLGPASVTLDERYSAPNPTEQGGTNWTLILVLGAAAYLLFTPAGQADKAKIESYLASKFQGGAPVGG